MGVPYKVPAPQDPKASEVHSSITASNKSPQTPQAAAQDAVAGRSQRNSVISGAGSSIRRISNGKIGGKYGHGR